MTCPIKYPATGLAPVVPASVEFLPLAEQGVVNSGSSDCECHCDVAHSENPLALRLFKVRDKVDIGRELLFN